MLRAVLTLQFIINNTVAFIIVFDIELPNARYFVSCAFRYRFVTVNVLELICGIGERVETQRVELVNVTL